MLYLSPSLYLSASLLIMTHRWSELTHSLKFHAQLAHAAKAPTEFRLLNNCDPIMVGDPLDVEGDGLHVALQVFEEETPSGQTPLCYHIGGDYDMI